MLGLQFGAGGPAVSLLVSKAGGGYRLQSDCFQAMWLVVQVGLSSGPFPLLMNFQSGLARPTLRVGLACNIGQPRDHCATPARPAYTAIFTAPSPKVVC